jgi:hypothetical protein
MDNNWQQSAYNTQDGHRTNTGRTQDEHRTDTGRTQDGHRTNTGQTHDGQKQNKKHNTESFKKKLNIRHFQLRNCCFNELTL